jgi:hypothetical protein
LNQTKSLLLVIQIVGNHSLLLLFRMPLHPGEPLGSALVSLTQCLKASIELSERTGVDDVGHCLDLATVEQVAGCLAPSFEASPALALCCAETV